MEDEVLERIDRYVMGVMNADERKQFESEIASNPEMARELELQHSLIAGLNIYDDKTQFDKLFQEVSREQQVSHVAKVVHFSRRRRNVLAIAASIAILIFAGLWIFLPSSEPVEITNYLPAVDGVLLRDQLSAFGAIEDPNTTTPESYDMALEAYESDDFPTALMAFEKLKASSEENTYIAAILEFYIADILLRNGSCMEALDKLERLEGQNLPFKAEIEQHMIMALICMGDRKQAKKMIDELPESHSFYQAAQRIMEEVL